MLPSSMRRVVGAAPQASLLSNLAPAATTLPFVALTARSQRRRYSSSKPSSPNDSPKGLPAGQMTASPAQSSKPSGEKRKRKSKDSSNNNNNNNDADADLAGKLPSVPSTQHVPKESIALSTFFSLHRPMSVTQGFPKAVTHEAFAQIFAAPSKANKFDDVLSTLSKTVDSLEHPMQGLNISHDSADATHTHMPKIEVRTTDGSAGSIEVQLNAMSGQFLPFRPPPLPQPESTSVAAAGAETAAEAQPQHRVYKAIFTLEETTEPNGEVRIVAHSPTLVERNTAPRNSVERMALRQLRREGGRGRATDMHAISVRRQRKLKMKKRKYKKLMRRTRNERRKLDRI